MTKRTADVLEQFLKEFGNPPERAIENSRDRLLDRFGSAGLYSGEFVDVQIPLGQTRPYHFAWAAGLALATVLVSVLVWSQGPPFAASLSPAGADGHLMSKLSSQQDGVTVSVAVPQDDFELASVKLLAPSSEATKAVEPFDQMQALMTGCPGGYMYTTRIDPGRLTIPAATVLTLVMAAYGQDCKLVEGGPAWTRSEHYEINALLPAGTPRYTVQNLMKGEAPELQRMLQKLLADRFRLAVKRELREMSVYTLTVATPGKMKVSPDETRLPNVSLPAGFRPPIPLGIGQEIGLVLPGENQMSGHAVSVSSLAKSLRQRAGRMVFDKTGFSGLLDYDLRFSSEIEPVFGAAVPASAPPPIPPVPGAPLPAAESPAPSLRDALANQLGLKLESTKMPVEVLIIESVERPSEN